jgi:hypothetical protein
MRALMPDVPIVRQVRAGRANMGSFDSRRVHLRSELVRAIIASGSIAPGGRHDAIPSTNTEQGARNMLGQAYARAQVFDQEFRRCRRLVDTPLINPQDNLMVPNTFESRLASPPTWMRRA